MKGKIKKNKLNSPYLTPLKFTNIPTIQNEKKDNDTAFENLEFEKDCEKWNSDASIKLIKNEIFDYIQENIWDVEEEKYKQNLQREISNKKELEEILNKKKISKPKIKNHRYLKDSYQLEVLEKEYNINIEWSKEKVTEISNLTKLSEYQVYKWNWDKRKKK